MRKYLPQRGQKDLRGWEWRYLWRLTRSDDLFQLGPHSHVVTDVTFSPNGQYVLSASEDQTIKLWNVITREAVATLRHERSGVRSIAMSRDAKLLASGDHTGTIHLWDLPSKQITRTLTNSSPVLCLALSTDDRLLAAGSFFAVQIWEVATGLEVARLPVSHDIYLPVGMAFSPDGKAFAYHKGEGTIALLDLATLSETRLLAGHSSFVFGLAFSPDARKLASSGFDETVRIWDGGSLSEVARLTNHTAWVGPVVFSHDGAKLATGGADQSVRLWDTATWRELATLKGHLAEVWSIEFSPDDQRLVTGGSDETVRVWSAQSKTEEIPLRRSSVGIRLMVFTADNRKIFAVYTNGTCGPIELSSLAGTDRDNYPRFDDGQVAAVSPSARHVAVVFRDGSVRLWSPGTEQQPSQLSPPGAEIQFATFTEHGRTLVLARTNHIVELWDVHDRMKVATVEAWIEKSGREKLSSTAISPDGRILAIGYMAGAVQLCHIAQRRKIVAVGTHRYLVGVMVFSPDGNVLATGSADAKVKLWDARNGRELATLGAIQWRQQLGLLSRRRATGRGEQ